MSDDALRALGFQFASQSAALIDLADRRLLACNRAFSVLLGYSEEELVDRPLDTLIPESSVGALREALEATRTSPLSGHDTVLPLRREDGTEVRVRLRSRLIEESGGSSGRVVVGVDEIEPRSSKQDAFFDMLAHELRNRLSNLRLTVQVLNREEAPAGSRWGWGLAAIDQEVAELDQLTNDLLDVSRMARGRVRPGRAPVDLVAAARAAEGAWVDRGDADAPALRVKAPTGPMVVWGDDQRLQQVISLIATLAATPDAQNIDVSLVVNADCAHLTVVGPGLEPSLFPNDFDLFAAAARAATDRPGLGLEPLLVVGLVDRMDGELKVRPGAVELVLPLAGVPAPPDTADESGSATPSIVHRRQVLVVDDDRGAANTLVQLLSTFGHTVEMAHDGETGLRLAIASRPQVALLDIKLPRMDGYTLARRLRSTLGAEITLIALTGLDDPRDRARVREAGFDHHLVKPVDVDRLKALVTAR